ncbi:hypothetical protein OVA24_10555 [Luteolibacter sp. SL250]|uniref:hypothetical protein n=1 Tax=Luteolibacter sp. SL250 TaxID=2995170 RepID=UPI00226E19CC|nr:hypothetical protein [Luteolibacter sp. SL250]WAC21825.1 hypothetical protein OVA24_10555 [Luteolibacter sp. SL250]
MKSLLPTLSLCAFLALPTASAAVIYQHSFGGSSANTLNGVSLDTASGLHGGSAGTTWLASDTRFLADGSTTNAATSAAAYVPFSPVNGFIYTISLDVTATAMTSNTARFTMSLLDFGGTGSPSLGADFQATANHTTYGTIGLRTSDFNDSGNKYNFLTWTGAGTGGASHLNHTTPGTWNLSIILDTTVTNAWTLALIGTSDSGQILSRTGTIPSTASIDHIMLTNYQRIEVGMESFSVTAIPEPGLTLLSSIGGLLLFRRARQG